MLRPCFCFLAWAFLATAYSTPLETEGENVANYGTVYMRDETVTNPTPVIDPVLDTEAYNNAVMALKAAEAQIKQSPHGIRGVLQNLFTAFGEAFQELVNRQQAFLNLIYCKTCGSNPWQNFLTAMSNIPTLGWVLGTHHSEGQKPAGTFIAATNVNGVVNGVGGSIYGNEPVVEYTFNNNHVTSVKPQRLDQSLFMTTLYMGAAPQSQNFTQ